jgi:hypothetical protein
MLKVPSGQIGSASEWCHWISLDKDISRNKFRFLNFDLEYLKRLPSSEPLSTKCLQPPASAAQSSYRIRFSYWLAHFFDEKIHQSAALFWFGSRDVEILQIFYS